MNEHIYHESFYLMISRKTNLHQSLLGFLGFSFYGPAHGKSCGFKFEEICRDLKECQTLSEKCELKDFLYYILHLWDLYQSDKEIICKIEYFILFIKKEIKQSFSEKEIFDIFGFCKNILIILILFEEQILSMETIVNNISVAKHNSMRIIFFLYPEIRKYNEEYFRELMFENQEKGLKEFVQKHDEDLESFYKLRKEGEKLPEIIELIKADNVEEFIAFVERFKIDLNKKIKIEETIFNSNPKNLTPIEYSALFCSLSIFQYLYEKDAQSSTFVKDNDNIVECAIQGRSNEIIHLLERVKGIEEEFKSTANLQRYLKIAVKMHFNEICKYLINKYNCPISEEIVYLIVINRNYKLLDDLYDNNNIDITNGATMSKVFFGFCINGNEEIVKILINLSNINFNSKDNDGKTPLHWSCFLGNLETVKLMINHSFIDINSKDNDGQTPFHLACNNGKLEIVKIMIDNPNLDINAKNAKGLTPFHYACILNQIEMVKILITNPNLDMNSIDNCY